MQLVSVRLRLHCSQQLRGTLPPEAAAQPRPPLCAAVAALSAPEAFLPVQACIELLGPRLRATAVHALLRMVVAGMERREEWQVRRAAAETLAKLAVALCQQQGGAPPANPAPDSGLAALVEAQQPLLAAVEQHIKYDRVPQVRQAAAAVVQVGLCVWLFY